MKEAIIKTIKVRPDLKKTEVFLKKIPFEKKEGKTYIYLIALGAGEYWGPNKNGDFFPESELKKYYKTFEKALVYRKHEHKPEKACGRVLKAFFNDDMKRVELLVEIDNEKAPDVVRKINEGKVIDFSMGVSIAFDVCSICGNRAYTKADYCHHIRDHLLEILPDGRQVYMINYGLNFFDISIVDRRADITAVSLVKVAEANGNGTNFDLASKRLLAMREPIKVDLIKKIIKFKGPKRKGIAFIFGLLIRPEEEEFFEASDIELPTKEEVCGLEPLLDYSFFRPFLLARILANLDNNVIEEKDWPEINNQILDSYFFGDMEKKARFFLKPTILGAILTPVGLLGYTAYRRQQILAGKRLPGRFDILMAKIPEPAAVIGSSIAGGILFRRLAKLFKKGEVMRIVDELPYTFDLDLINFLNTEEKKNDWYYNKIN